MGISVTDFRMEVPYNGVTSKRRFQSTSNSVIDFTLLHLRAKLNPFTHEQILMKYHTITDRTRSMGEGTAFTGVCHSFCPHLWSGGGCLVSGAGMGRQNPKRWLLPRSVRILLECILVFNKYSLWSCCLDSYCVIKPCSSACLSTRFSRSSIRVAT